MLVIPQCHASTDNAAWLLRRMGQLTKSLVGERIPQGYSLALNVNGSTRFSGGKLTAKEAFIAMNREQTASLACHKSRVTAAY